MFQVRECCVWILTHNLMFKFLFVGHHLPPLKTEKIHLSGESWLQWIFVMMLHNPRSVVPSIGKSTGSSKLHTY